MKKVLITGGIGFIGTNLVRRPLVKEYAIHVLDNFSTGQRSYLAELDIELVEGDILDRDVVETTVRDINGVIHLAAQISVPDSAADPFYACQQNLLGHSLYWKHAVRPIFRALYLPRLTPRWAASYPPTHEAQAPMPISPYGAGKLAEEGC